MSLRERRSRLRGLYAVTPEEPSLERLVMLVAAAIDGGARLVQYRAKLLGASERLRQACALVALCRSRSVPLIINDDTSLAVSVGADGVHLGQEDGDPAHARQRLPDAIIGISCYDQPHLAVRARKLGADYVAIGSLFASTTKPGAVAAPLALIAEARDVSGLPVAGIGGITATNAADAVAAGADMIAVVGALFRAPDVKQAARALSLPYAME